jgi:hypothetical protein
MHLKEISSVSAAKSKVIQAGTTGKHAVSRLQWIQKASAYFG